jgi:hypothetical protein
MILSSIFFEVPLAAPLFVSIVLAIITLLQWWVARKQAQTAKNQLRLSLLERRIVVRDALLTMVGTIIEKDDLTEEQLKACARGTKDAEFLFPNKDIEDYCRLLLNKAVEFRTQKNLMRLNQSAGSEEAKEQQIEHFDGLKWWSQQEQEIHRRFNRFLKVKE